jgi:hypothetical protein
LTYDVHSAVLLFSILISYKIVFSFASTFNTKEFSLAAVYETNQLKEEHLCSTTTYFKR